MVKKIAGLISEEYEHPFDREALKNFKNLPGINPLFKKIYELRFERIVHIINAGSSYKISQTNNKRLFDLFAFACNTLNIQKQPDLYIIQDPTINASTLGVENPFVMVNTKSIECFDDNELLYLFGHELGHIKSNHPFYSTLGLMILPGIGQIVGNLTLGIGDYVSDVIIYTLLYWVRMAEFTCDRAGLLACQNENAVYRGLAKISGLPEESYDSFNTEEFLQQGEEFAELDFDSFNQIAKALLVSNQTHPWSILRSVELKKWIDTGSYKDILERTVRVTVNGLNTECPFCKSKIKGHEIFCPNCGGKI
jgi:Zn-dependent protease with chaperone function